MTKALLAAYVLMACSLAVGKDAVPLALSKGARVGIVNMLDPEITHFHTSKVLTQSFLKTRLVGWPFDLMLNDPLSQRLTQMGFVPIVLGPGDTLARKRDEFFVNNSVVKGLPRECAKEMVQLAASGHLDALIVVAPGLNNASQAGSAIRKTLPDYLRGMGFVTSAESTDKPVLFNMTQMLLISVTPDGATLRAREWGGAYTDEWADYIPPPDPKQVPLEQLDKAQPLFARILARQASKLVEWLQVSN